jgi:hypothetical protein
LAHKTVPENKVAASPDAPISVLHSEVLTAARIQADLGLRGNAQIEIASILKALKKNAPATHEPYLASSAAFERIECGGDTNDWMVAAVSAWLAKN